MKQRILDRRTQNSKTPTSKTVQRIAQNNQLPLTGRPHTASTGMQAQIIKQKVV